MRRAFLAGLCVFAHSTTLGAQAPGGAGDTVTAAAVLVARLDATARDRVHAGQSVRDTTHVAGRPWPQVDVYRAVAATPEACAAVVADVAHQRDVLPGIVKRSRRLDPAPGAPPNEVDLESVIIVPMARDVKVVMRHLVERGPTGILRVRWTLGHADHVRAIEGFASCEPLAGDAGTGPRHTLLHYRQLIVPDNDFLGWFVRWVGKGRALDTAVRTTELFAQAAETPSPRLERASATLRALLP